THRHTHNHTHTHTHTQALRPPSSQNVQNGKIPTNKPRKWRNQSKIKDPKVNTSSILAAASPYIALQETHTQPAAPLWMGCVNESVLSKFQCQSVWGNSLS